MNYEKIDVCERNCMLFTWSRRLPRRMMVRRMMRRRRV
jgi:hypothetical protein